jgi:hypothetical protein
MKNGPPRKADRFPAPPHLYGRAPYLARTASIRCRNPAPIAGFARLFVENLINSHERACAREICAKTAGLRGLDAATSGADAGREESEFAKS